jgi:Protein of unknown function (DUF2716)
MNNWKILSEVEYNRAWDYIFDELNFNPSPYEAKKFDNLPIPNLWFDTASIFDGIFTKNDFDELNTIALNLLQKIANNKSIYALDWQHECFSFNPNLPFDRFENKTWGIPFLPDGDSTFFLTNDLSNGVFGDGINLQMCFWGDELLNAFENINTPKILSNQMTTFKKIPRLSS